MERPPNNTKKHGISSCKAWDLRFKKQEMALVEGELRKLMKLLDYQLETMPGIDVVTASALVAEIRITVGSSRLT